MKSAIHYNKIKMERMSSMVLYHAYYSLYIALLSATIMFVIILRMNIAQFLVWSLSNPLVFTCHTYYKIHAGVDSSKNKKLKN